MQIDVNAQALLLALSTNATAGSFAVAYDVAAQTSTFPGIGAGQAMLPASGWFSIPLTNNTTRVVWGTNITMNSAGYWRLNWLTNTAVQHMTNVSIRAYVKPFRTQKDR